jgi:hypothetical protein
MAVSRKAVDNITEFVRGSSEPPCYNIEVRMPPTSVGTTLMHQKEFAMKTRLFNIDPRVVYVLLMLGSMAAAAGAGVGPMHFSAP